MKRSFLVTLKSMIATLLVVPALMLGVATFNGCKTVRTAGTAVEQPAYVEVEGYKYPGHINKAVMEKGTPQVIPMDMYMSMVVLDWTWFDQDGNLHVYRAVFAQRFDAEEDESGVEIIAFIDLAENREAKCFLYREDGTPYLVPEEVLQKAVEKRIEENAVEMEKLIEESKGQEV